MVRQWSLPEEEIMRHKEVEDLETGALDWKLCVELGNEEAIGASPAQRGSRRDHGFCIRVD